MSYFRRSPLSGKGAFPIYGSGIILDTSAKVVSDSSLPPVSVVAERRGHGLAAS